jgi:isocitrate/isopropylmalate dehydrogenase
LRHLETQELAISLEGAVKQIYKEQKIPTYQQGGNAKTKEFPQKTMKKLK